VLCALARVNSPIRVFQLNEKFAQAAEILKDSSREFTEGLLKMPALFDFLRALRASAVQSPSPASQKSLKTRDLEEKD